MLLFFSTQSVLGKMNEIAKNKAAIEDAETQNKVGFHSHSVCDVNWPRKLVIVVHGHVL